MRVAIFVTLLIALALGYKSEDIVSARIESCRGCSLNRLPEVKKFVLDDAPGYSRVEVKFITGAPPELVLLGDRDEELDRLSLSQLTREECNNLLQKNGFSKKTDKSEF